MKIIVPAGSGFTSAEMEEKKSKFIGLCCFLDSLGKAREITAQLKAEHKFAHHVVHAFIIGKPESYTMGMSDDGEPKGTAGKPILQVLKGSNITNIYCAVIRYYGGIKLGTGGLVKAYTQCTQKALLVLETKELIEEKKIEVIIPYELYETVKRIIINTNNGKITNEEFLSKVKVNSSVPIEEWEKVKAEITSATSGKAVFL